VNGESSIVKDELIFLHLLFDLRNCHAERSEACLEFVAG